MERYISISKAHEILQKGDYVSLPIDKRRFFILSSEDSGLDHDQEFCNSKVTEQVVYYGGTNEEGRLVFLGIKNGAVVGLGPGAKVERLDDLCSKLYNIENKGIKARCIKAEDLGMFKEYSIFPILNKAPEGVKQYVLVPVFEVDASESNSVIFMTNDKNGKSMETAYQLM